MIDVQQVRELIELMVEHNLSEIRVREGDTSISLRKGPWGGVEIMGAGHAVPLAATHPPAFAQAGSTLPVASDQDKGLLPITSPMVGTYYAAPDPDSPKFVEIGTVVTPDTPVCIIEAMKVFNEIKAEVSGTVERILVENRQAVEFGQPLMLVRPH